MRGLARSSSTRDLVDDEELGRSDGNLVDVVVVARVAAHVQVGVATEVEQVALGDTIFIADWWPGQTTWVGRVEPT